MPTPMAVILQFEQDTTKVLLDGRVYLDSEPRRLNDEPFMQLTIEREEEIIEVALTHHELLSLITSLELYRKD